MICWIHRLLRFLGNDSAHNTASRWQRHLDKCPRCRQEALDTETVARALRQAPRPPAAPPNPFLQQRILRALRAETAPTRTRRNPSLMWRLAGSTVALAALAMVLAMLHHRAIHSKTPSPNRPAGWGTLVPSASALARWGLQLDDPLQAEGQLVLQDARNAVAGLAHALPGDLIASYWPSAR